MNCQHTERSHQTEQSKKKKKKKQINIQQVKEHDKCLPKQTKEEELRSLPQKEFRIVIAKMIKNLENKMELEINRRETKIKKMQKCLART